MHFTDYHLLVVKRLCVNYGIFLSLSEDSVSTSLGSISEMGVCRGFSLRTVPNSKVPSKGIKHEENNTAKWAYNIGLGNGLSKNIEWAMSDLSDMKRRSTYCHLHEDPALHMVSLHWLNWRMRGQLLHRFLSPFLDFSSHMLPRFLLCAKR